MSRPHGHIAGGAYTSGTGPTGYQNTPGLGGLGPSATGFAGIPTRSSQGTPTSQSVNYSFKIVFAATGVPQAFPPLKIAPGWAVSVRGNNGTTDGNANAIYVARNRSALLLPSQTQTITPDTEISFPVDNVGQIWAVGTEGDGAIVSIRYGIA